MKINAASLYGVATWTAVNVALTLRLSTSANDLTVIGISPPSHNVTITIISFVY